MQSEGLHKIVAADDVIIALSTPIGRSGIGVVRMSGKGAREIAATFLKSKRPLTPRRATVGIWATEQGEAVDQVIVTYFKGPCSYTGEDVVEVSAHGNPVVLGRIIEMVRGAGARPAAPGEFTLRAVANRKIDLVQAEAVRDFIVAQTEAQAKLALRQMEGGLSQRLAPVKDALLDIIAALEAAIDFAEDDLELPCDGILAERIEAMRHSLEEVRETYARGRIVTAGVRIAIVGKPNVGKSSLFNRLVAAERAIVTEIPGTTRDVLTEMVDFDGVPVRLFDTAGLRESGDEIEIIGMTRSLETLAEADLVFMVIDGSAPLDNDDQKLLDRARRARHVVVINKADLPQAVAPSAFSEMAHSVSAKTGLGMDGLKRAVLDFVGASSAEDWSESVLTNARQHDAVAKAVAAVAAAGRALQERTPHEMVLLDCYSALGALNELTGDAVLDDILDRIFSTFCIGK